jgi:hypothetical protein
MLWLTLRSLCIVSSVLCSETTTGGGGASGLSLNTNPSWDTIHYHFDSSVYSILFDTTTTPFFIPVVLWLNHLLSSCMMHNTVLSNHSRTIGVHCRFCVYNKMLCCNGDYSYRKMTNERMSKYKPKWSASYRTPMYFAASKKHCMLSQCQFIPETRTHLSTQDTSPGLQGGV